MATKKAAVRKKPVRKAKDLIADVLRDVDPAKFKKNMSTADFIRLLQLWKEQGGSRQPRQVKVMWVEEDGGGE